MWDLSSASFGVTITITDYDKLVLQNALEEISYTLICLYNTLYMVRRWG